MCILINQRTALLVFHVHPLLDVTLHRHGPKIVLIKAEREGDRFLEVHPRIGGRRQAVHMDKAGIRKMRKVEASLFIRDHRHAVCHNQLFDFEPGQIQAIRHLDGDSGRCLVDLHLGLPLQGKLIDFSHNRGIRQIVLHTPCQKNQ